MEKLIYRYEDYNIAGSEWTWKFFLAKEGPTYVLSCQHECAGEVSTHIGPETDLRNGAEIYWALQFMIAEITGFKLNDSTLPPIAEQIAEISSTTATEFLTGPDSEDTRGERESMKEEARRAEAAARRAEALKPFREKIDDYVLRFSDRPLRYPGGGTYGNYRSWARRFLEDYAIQNGHLPTGKRQIKVVGGVGYSGPSHDFSDME